MKVLIKLKVLFVIMILISNFSCTKSDPEQPIGLWNDNINLSQKEAKLSAENDSTVITTKGEWWWINGITLNGVNVEFDKNIASKPNFVIDETDFRIERKNATEIHIEMKKNQTRVDKILKIGLQAGDYFDGIKITQSKN